MLLLWMTVCLSVGAMSLCPRDCHCGQDEMGRRSVQCTKGGMMGPLPVKQMDLDVETLRITAPEENENVLTIGPIFQGFQRLEEVHITHSNVPAIGKHSFWGVPSLRILNLTDNNISLVLDNNFRGLVNLVELYLDDNRIESMGSGTFHHLSELRVLSLTNNRISLLSPRLFLKLGKLRYLDLSYNQFDYLDPEVFKDVQELRTFACRGCSLRNINPHIYSLLSNLAHLDLGDNQFMYLDKEEFRDLKKLTSLKIDGNHYPVVLEGTFEFQTKLLYLNIARSHIAKVTNHAFDNLTSLVELDLSYNKLGRLEPITFQPLATHLRSLSISGNNIRIEEFTYVLQVTTKLKELGLADLIVRPGLPLGLFAQLEGLRRLNLSGNELTHFPVQILSPFGKLMELDLSRNKFHGLDERLVARFENIQMVYLSGNPWACDLCHITPMMSRANGTAWLKTAVCWLPYHLRGRTVDSLSVSELSWCGSGLGYKEIGFAGLALTHSTQLGLIAAGAAVILLVLTMAGVIAGLFYNRHHAAFYYTNEEKRKAEAEKMCNGSNGTDKKVSIATIDEITKDPELELLTNGS